MGKSNRLFVWSVLIGLALIWGSSFVLIKQSLVAFNPLQIGAMRMGIAGLLLLPFSMPMLRKLSWKQHLNLGSVGFLGNFVPAFLFPLAETEIHSSLAGMLNVLTPIFTMLVGALLFGVIVTPRKWIGVVVGLIGAAFLIGGGDLAGIKGNGNLAYSWLIVLATVCYGFSLNLMKRYLEGISSVTATSIALFWMVFPSVLIALVSGIPQVMAAHPDAWMSLGAVTLLAAMGTAFALLLFYRLVQITDPVLSSSVTYLVPIIAIGWGIFLGEHLHLIQWLSMPVVLLGVYLVNSPSRKMKGVQEIVLEKKEVVVEP